MTDKKLKRQGAKKRQDRVRADTSGRGQNGSAGQRRRNGVAASTISWRFLALGISWRLGVFAATIARNDPDARRMKQAAPAAKAK
jgi:hypothetical protein